MRVSFTISIAKSNDHPGIDYALSAEMSSFGFEPGSLECESYTVFHNDWGDEVFPDHPARVAGSCLCRHRQYIIREARRAWELEVSRMEREAEEVSAPNRKLEDGNAA